MNRSLKIKDYMRLSPRTIGEDINLSKALEMMREFRVRHLPVLRAGVLVGVLSDRDVRLALSVYPAAKDMAVGDIMTERPYCIPGETLMNEVLTEMTIYKYGCAIVVNDKGRTVGIFTAADAVRVLADFFAERVREQGRTPLMSHA